MRKIRISTILILISLGVVIYCRSLLGAFVWDDIMLVVNNDFIKGFRLLGQIFTMPLSASVSADYMYYRPLQTVSYIFDYSLWGLNPFGFHLTNLLLHILSVILLYWFLKILFSNEMLAFFTALLFLLHPLNASVVSYISGRADTLLLVFGLLSVIFFLRSRDHKGYLFSLLCYLFALLSKESALLLFFTLVSANEIYLDKGIDVSETRKRHSRIWYVIFFAAALIYLSVRIYILGKRSLSALSPDAGLLDSIAVFPEVILRYLGLIFYPIGLHPYRNIDLSGVLSAYPIISVLVGFVILAGLWQAWRKNKIVFFSSVFFAVWIIPVLFLMRRYPEFASQPKAIMAESWLYMPEIGIFILIAYAVVYLCDRLGRALPIALFSVFLCGISVVTFTEIGYWKNNFILFSHTLKYVQNSTIVYKNLGYIYLNEKNNQRAIEMYSHAVDLPQSQRIKASSYKDLAYAYFSDQQMEKAINACRESIKLDPRYPDAYAYLGLIYSRAKDISRAGEYWTKAMDLDPFNAIAFNGLLGMADQKNNIRDELILRYEGLFGRYPGFERYKIYRALGIIHFYADDCRQALINLKNALKIDPYDVKSNETLAVCYARTGNSPEALRSFKLAVRLNPFDKELYYNFARFYASSGEDRQAQELLKKAETLNLFR